MMEYNAFEIGPALEQIRKDKKMTREDVSAVTGLSVSSICLLYTSDAADD